MKYKYVKSINPHLSGRQASKSVIQTIYDIAWAHGGELKVETLTTGVAVQTGSKFIIQFPNTDPNH